MASNQTMEGVNRIGHLSATYSTHAAAMEADISVRRQAIEELRALKEKFIQMHGVFDHEDVGYVEASINEHELELKRLQNDYDVRGRMLKRSEGILRCMTETLDKRETVLEEPMEARILSANPELLASLAAKQVSLRQNADTKLAKILREAGPIRN